MDFVTYLRDCVRQCEDKKISVDQLARELGNVARSLQGDDDGPARQMLVRLSNRLRALTERNMFDDVGAELRATIDELQDELLQF